MNPGDVTILLDELILDGFPTGDYARAATAFSNELGRLLHEGGIPHRLLRGEQPAPALALTLVPGATPEQAFVQAARVVYRGWAAVEGRVPREEKGENR